MCHRPHGWDLEGQKNWHELQLRINNVATNLELIEKVRDLINQHYTLKVAPHISSSGAGTAVILFLGFSKLLSSPTAVEKKHPAKPNAHH